MFSSVEISMPLFSERRKSIARVSPIIVETMRKQKFISGLASAHLSCRSDFIVQSDQLRIWHCFFSGADSC